MRTASGWALARASWRPGKGLARAPPRKHSRTTCTRSSSARRASWRGSASRGTRSRKSRPSKPGEGRIDTATGFRTPPVGPEDRSAIRTPASRILNESDIPGRGPAVRGLHPFFRLTRSMDDALRRRFLLAAERTSWALGIAGLVGLGVFHVRAASATRNDLERFRALQAAAGQTGTPDQSLWSPVRVSAWRAALIAPAPAPLAVVRIPTIRLEVPVMPGTADRTLAPAFGNIDDTALPGAEGTSGIAGHRDGFFRGLKDIVPGDEIELETLNGKEIYRVERTWVVDPADVTVLDPTRTR